VRGGQPGDLFGEGGPAATTLGADEPAYQQTDHHRLSRQRGVGQAALVAAMHPAGSGATAWAFRLGGRCSRLDRHTVFALPHQIYHYTA
jgi:hypothetical protein